jgi:antibiotic biosynthesis monooxygenase (ABM) superfamily enzyme
VGSGAIGPSEQGWSVALSADGNTAIVGGIVDNKLTGAAWVFTRSNDVWTQQGSKLVGVSVVGQAGQGVSVALSADGDTALVGGPYDNSRTGAAWVFTRSGGAWTQQGKLVGTGAVGQATQGVSVALSADGNTAIVGGSYDNSKAGAAWVFTRGGGVWTQQGSKLVGVDPVGNAAQGVSVALSADGSTAIVGGPADDSYAGAVWIFNRSGGVWKQFGSKLVGSGAVGKAGQGYSVALSADGNTAIVGGLGDNANTGAAWVFSRSGATWSQQGSKLVGSRAVGESKQGHSVALSADGNTAIVGGLGDNSYNGAAWAFSRSGAVWSQQGDKLVGIGAVGHAEQGFSGALSADGNTAVVGGIADNRVTGAAWVHNRRDGIWTQGPFLGY